MRDLAQRHLRPSLKKALRNFWDEAVVRQIMHQKAVRKARAYAGRKHLKLNLGCGNNVRQGWVNVDIRPLAELHLDLRRDLPFDSGSCSLVYSEHFFEHLEYPNEVNHFLRECLRVLDPGGFFEVGVPDSEWPVTAYGTGDDSYFEAARTMWHPKWATTRMQHLNMHFRGEIGEHKYGWDAETLVKVLKDNGFSSAERREFDPELDSEKRKLGTLYVRAQKAA